MDALQTSEGVWTACPQCRAANPAASSFCTACRTSLRAGQSSPPPTSLIARPLVITIITISVIIIAMAGALVLAVIDSRSPDTWESARRLHYCYSLAWGVCALRVGWSGWWMFRARRLGTGIVLTLVMLLFALISIGMLAPPSTSPTP